MTRVEIR